MDGTGVDRRFIPVGSCGIAVVGKYIYWMNNAESVKPVTIGRANLDGSAVNNQFITGIHDFCGGLAIG